MPADQEKILIVVTSHGELGDIGKPTGFFYEELATPYWVFVDAGYTVDIASIQGGRPPHDPNSLSSNEDERPAAVQRFVDHPGAMSAMESTLSIDTVDPNDYAAIFLPGGHGTMWDFPTSAGLARVLGDAFQAGKVIGAVCHGPAGLLGARRSDGEPLVKDRRVNSFTNGEEQAVELTEVVPFLLESRLREQGARFEGGDNFTPYCVQDGKLITGQNPMSSQPVAEAMVRALA